MVQCAKNATSDTVDYGVLVEQIRLGEQTAIQKLYTLIGKGMSILIAHQLRYDLVEDTLHDSFMALISALKAGQLKTPDALMGFAHTIVRRQIMARIEVEVQRRKEQGIDSCFHAKSRDRDPEEELGHRERVALMKTVLMELSSKDREVLVRFYLREQTQEQICTEMEMTETQFRLLKSRAKARFAGLGRQKIHMSSLCLKVRAMLGSRQCAEVA